MIVENVIFSSDILSYVLIEREHFGFYFLIWSCPYSPTFLPVLPVIVFLLKLEGQRQVRSLLVFMLFLDPFNCIHIESKLIRIVQV